MRTPTQTMKVHEMACKIFDSEPSLSLGYKRFRSLAPRLPTATSDSTAASLDLKSFIRPESGPRRLFSPDEKDPSDQVETHPGGTRWNPTQEQIRILEMLYEGGMRTPNAQQIEHITSQLGRYGKIEGKNVFYWFQNHKARERQKQKRNSLGISQRPRTTPSPPSQSLDFREGQEREDCSYSCKRKCTSLKTENSEPCEVDGDGTLELFPLHPEGLR